MWKKDPGKLEAEGMQLLQKGKIEKGLQLMHRAVELDPENPNRHMNFGSMLLNMGVGSYQAGDIDTARNIQSTAAHHLEKATELFGSDQPELCAHCFYLLGQINYHVFDRVKAEEWYRKAVATFANHPQASAALNTVEATRPLIWDATIPASERRARLAEGEHLIFTVPSAWKLGFDLVLHNQCCLEWTPHGQDVHGWTDLLTVSMDDWPDVSPRQFADSLHESFNKNFQRVEVDGPTENPVNGHEALTVGFAYSDPKPDYAAQTLHILTKAHQYSSYKLIRGKDCFYQILREWRGDTIGDDHPLRSEHTRARWQALLDSAEICDRRAPGFEPCQYLTDENLADRLGPGARICVVPPIKTRLVTI